MPENFLSQANTFFNIGSFVNNLGTAGTLPTNKYVVQMSGQLIGGGAAIAGVSSISQLIALRAESVHVPGFALTGESNNRYGIGPRQRFPSNINFTESTITFLDDGNNNIWKFLYGWANNIIQFSGQVTPTYRLGYKSQYAQTITIYILDNMGNNITTIDLLEAFPISVNGINLSWADNNNLMRITASFSFTRWNERSISSSIPNPLSLINFGPIIPPTSAPYVAF